MQIRTTRGGKSDQNSAILCVKTEFSPKNILTFVSSQKYFDEMGDLLQLICHTFMCEVSKSLMC